MNSNSLEDLLPAEVGSSLSEAEKLLLLSAPKGVRVDAVAGADSKKPATSESHKNRPLSNTIRAKLLAWLISDESAVRLVNATGINIDGAQFIGRLDLNSLTISFNLVLTNCTFPDGINVAHARLRSLILNGSSINQLNARSLIASGTVVMRNTTVTQECSFQGASVGDLDCIGANFIHPNQQALTADRLEASGAVFLDQVTVEGSIVLLGARVGATLSFTHARILNPKAIGIGADRLIANSVFFDDTDVTGDTRFVGAKIRVLTCENSFFRSGVLYAFTADNATFDGPVYLRNSTLVGALNVLGASVAGSLECTEITVKSPDGKAFIGDGLTTRGNLSLRDSIFFGEVRLLGANVGRNLDCKGARIRNLHNYSLNADGLNVRSSLDLRKLDSEGEVRLVSAHAGDLNCDGATLKNDHGTVLHGTNMEIEGSIFLRNAAVFGEFRINHVNAASLWCNDSDFQNPKGFVLFAEKSTFTNNICLRSLKHSPQGKVNLLYAKTFALLDDKTSWPQKPNLLINGFEYQSLGPDAPPNLDRRLHWLRSQPDIHFLSQPYEQLARVFRQNGLEEDARTILIEKQKARRKSPDVSASTKLKLWILGGTIGFGYEPWRATIWMVLFVALGWVIFEYAGLRGVMIGTEPEVDNQFAALMYSLDVFLPIVDFHQENYWLPSDRTSLGSLVKLYFWIHIALGWTVSSVLVAALTGLIRNK